MVLWVVASVVARVIGAVAMVFWVVVRALLTVNPFVNTEDFPVFNLVAFNIRCGCLD